MTSINFLDLKIYVDPEGALHTTIYRKPTDRNTILRADSFHPSSLISNSLSHMGSFRHWGEYVILTLTLKQSIELYRRFKQRGYKNKSLNCALSKTKSIERPSLFKSKPKNQGSNRMFCSLQYSKQTNKIKKSIKNWDILWSDSSLSSVFPETPQFVMKRAPTLKDKLVKNYVSAHKPKTLFTKPIGTFQCGAWHCPHINKGTHFKDSPGEKTFYCKHFQIFHWCGIPVNVVVSTVYRT